MPPVTINWSDLEIASSAILQSRRVFLTWRTATCFRLWKASLTPRPGGPRCPTIRTGSFGSIPRVTRAVPLDGTFRRRVQDQPCASDCWLPSTARGHFAGSRTSCWPSQLERGALVRPSLGASPPAHPNLDRAHADPGGESSTWGQVTAHEETADVPRLTHAGEAPGEILRRQARDLLERNTGRRAAHGTCVLQFLRERGTALLLGSAQDSHLPDFPLQTRTVTNLPTWTTAYRRRHHGRIRSLQSAAARDVAASPSLR